MKTLESIFSEIKENGVITKQQLQLLKIRSYKQQKDVINYDWLESVGYGYGIPLTEEQGIQGLNWLKKFIRKDGSSRVYGYHENIFNGIVIYCKLVNSYFSASFFLFFGLWVIIRCFLDRVCYCDGSKRA